MLFYYRLFLCVRSYWFNYRIV